MGVWVGLESSIAFCEGVQNLRCSLGELSFQRRQVPEKSLLLEEKSENIFIFILILFLSRDRGGVRERWRRSQKHSRLLCKSGLKQVSCLTF